MDDLRQRAEALVGKQSTAQGDVVRDLERLVHELEVHQVELQMQNEELRATQQELQEAHQRYFQLYDLAPMGYVTLDREGKIQEANRAAAALLGTDKRQLIGRRLSAFIVARDADRFHFHRERIFAPGAGKVSLEVALLRPPGPGVPVLLEAVAASDGPAGATRCRTAIVDLTDRRHAEQQLYEREASLNAILATAVDGIITIDDSGIIESFNPAACRIFGYAAEEVVGQPASLLMPDQLRGRYHALLARQLEREPHGFVDRTHDVLARRKGGATFPVELTVGELSSERPNARKFVGVVRDVSDRRRRDEQLRESLARFQQVADRIEDVFYIATPSTGRYVYVSPAGRDIFGWGPERVDTDAPAWLASVHADDQGRVREALALLQQGAVFDEEYRLLRPDGSVRLVRDRAFPLHTEDRVTGIVQDVTEERRLEAELRQAQRMEAVGTLASGIAHDFNNLLMGLAGFANLALKNLTPDHPAYSYVERGMQATMKGANLTQQLLGLSRRRRATTETVDLDRAVASAREIIARLVGEHIELRVEPRAPRVRITADTGEIEQILMNLASNARDAMPSGGTLTISTEEATEPEGEDVVSVVSLVVRDTGQGMDEATKARIFEPFFTTKAVGEGTGLGLSTVFGAVRRIGGHISVDSAPGQGTAIRLSFPIAERREDAVAVVGPAPSGSETVLLVEDDALVRVTVQSYLESLGYSVLVAENARQAVELATGRPGGIDVLLTDVVMPGRMGGALARELRASFPWLRVLFMSAHPADEHVRLGRIQKGEALLGKPFDQTALGFALHEVITGRSVRPAAPEAVPVARPARRSTRRGPVRVPQRPVRGVLVVDDNVDVAEAVRDALAFDGRHVAIAASGEEALRIARELRPDAVLCDLELGRMNGYDVARALRAAPELEGAFLVAITGYPQSDCRAAALEAGFDEVLTKPIGMLDLEELLGPVPADAS